MNRIALLSVSLLLAAAPAVARAQPVAPPARGATVTLSAQDQNLLARGEYSGLEIGISGLAGTFVGFGVGQAVQGRYLQRGWIFTLGEVGSIGLMLGSVMRCASSVGDSCSPALMIGGAVGLLAFHTWEVIDVWAAPFGHNRRVRAARARAQGGWSGFVMPTGGHSAAAGLALRF